jgi:hypothetical protein
MFYQCATNTCADDNTKHTTMAAGCTQSGFGQGKTLCIIGHGHGLMQPTGQITCKVMTIHVFNAGIPHQSCTGIDAAWRAKTHRMLAYTGGGYGCKILLPDVGENLLPAQICLCRATLAV